MVVFKWNAIQNIKNKTNKQRCNTITFNIVINALFKYWKICQAKN